MRTSLPKCVALSIAALALGGALAATPAFAGFYHGGGGGGGGMGGGYHAVGGGIGGMGGMGGSYHPVGGPSSHGFVSGNHVLPAGNAAPHARWIPRANRAWTGGPNRLASFSPLHRHHHHHRWGGGVFLPGYCDNYYDNYCNNGYTYDQDDCWVLRRVYNKYGKFVGWRRVYICAN